MKVLFLVNLPSPYRVRFFSELGKRCDLTVLFDRSSASDRDAKWKEDSHEGFREIYLKGVKLGTEDAFCPQVVRYLREEYDVIVIGMYASITGMIAMDYLRRRGIPFFISVDGGLLRQESSIVKKLKTHLISRGTCWLGTGKMAREYLLHYGGEDSKIFDYPFSSIDAAELMERPLTQEEKIGLRAKLGIAGGPVILAVGRFIPLKCFDVLLRAFCRLENREASLYFIGGTREQFCSVISLQIPENVHICPFMAKQELLEYYKAADLFVMPTRSDVWGLVVNEAMACGLPVLTTDKCGAGPELVHPGVNGAIVPAEDETALYQQLRELLESGKLAQMGEKSLEIIRGYTFQSMAEKHYEIFSRYLQMK